ncbi:MAG TPA: glycosyltransferase family 87 protein, partial [Chloroflexia bacterium]|nr:glycosyltransferase family 87 protein [Chloroflexia bacterium]
RTIILGQTSALALFGLAAGVVSLAHRQPRGAGLALALVGVKPQLLLLPLLALVCQRRWRALAWCAAASALLIGAGALLTGPQALFDYITLLRSADYAGYENLPQMQSWRALIEGTLGLQGAPAALLDGIGMLLAMILVAWAWRTPAPPADSDLGRGVGRGVGGWGLGVGGWAPYWDLRMALTMLLIPLFTPHLHMHDLLIWLVPGGLLLHHLYAPAGRAGMSARQRRAGFLWLWAGYLIVWPAWLMPDARLALWFSLAAAGWMVLQLRGASRETTITWAQTAAI